jgi:hypothetical protein
VPSAHAASPCRPPTKSYSRESPRRSPLPSSTRARLSPWNDAYAGRSPHAQVVEQTHSPTVPPLSPVLVASALTSTPDRKPATPGLRVRKRSAEFQAFADVHCTRKELNQKSYNISPYRAERHSILGKTSPIISPSLCTDSAIPSFPTWTDPDAHVHPTVCASHAGSQPGDLSFGWGNDPLDECKR